MGFPTSILIGCVVILAATQIGALGKADTRRQRNRGPQTLLKQIKRGLQVQTSSDNTSDKTSSSDDTSTSDNTSGETNTKCKPLKEDPRPVANWRFAEGNGGKDISEAGENPVIMTGISYHVGPKGEPNGAAVLPSADGQSMIVPYPSSVMDFRETGEMTFFTHMFINDIQAPNPIYAFDSSVNLFGNHLVLGRTTLQVSEGAYVFGAIPTADEWYKIAVTWKDNTYTFYVNGMYKGAGTDQLSDTSQALRFGYIQGNFSPASKMACAKFFDQALNAAQIGVLECDDVSTYDRL